MNHYLLEKRNSSLTFYSAHQARLQKDQNANSLANRIHLLKEEQQRALSRLYQARSKSHEVLTMKITHELKLQQKQKDAQTKVFREKERISYITQLRKQRDLGMLENQQTLQKMRYAQMAQIKQQSEFLARKKKEEILFRLRTNESKKREIKGFEERQQIKKREFFETKIRNFRQEYEMRIQKEQELKRKRELQISEMEIVEKELLQKLAQTQAVQKSVLQDLELTVSQPPKELMQRLGMYTPQSKMITSKVLPPVRNGRKTGLSKSYVVSRNTSFDNSGSLQRSYQLDPAENNLGSTNHSFIKSNASSKTMLEPKNAQKLDWSDWKNKAIPKEIPSDYEEIGEELMNE